MNQSQARTAPDSQYSLDLRRLRFAAPLEQAFQADYYQKTLPGLRFGFLLVVLLHLGVAAFDWLHMGAVNITNWLTPLVGLLLIGLTFWPGFYAVWQPAIVVLFSSLAFIILYGVAVGPSHPPPGMRMPDNLPLPGSNAPSRMTFLVTKELWLIIVGLLLTRLQFRWYVVGSILVCALSVTVAALAGHIPWDIIISSTMITVVVPVGVLMFVAYTREQGPRAEFLANYLLDLERAGEQRQRERTEGMLRVLSQAIGGIVHDLGNPLTAVQTGASSLMMFAKKNSLDQETTVEFAQIIDNGAQMLNYLRLSLIEQTRVLEGKPVPLECKVTSLRSILDAGALYQKPRFASGHKISFVGEDREVYVDEMKMIAVFMNLIGNALKYSDGEVQITWRAEGNKMLIGVLDMGQAGQGITQQQAEQLFVAFGRLETHSQIEGTGLGLLSAQKIVEAHTGEIFIEGYTDGTPASTPFSTAHGYYPSLLCEPFRTAFVVACPFQPTKPVPGIPT
ncbi:MAG: HAMP domain-containing histidine kinase [Abitibacteriaceae bacterium]|nr:HAMP domain-containing histidine kinase [Abditibacteriaceae bacterium]MBV9867042.1 HAMP domain-containing histidine kinase [Abditibacteriaceae bacterium]